MGLDTDGEVWLRPDSAATRLDTAILDIDAVPDVAFRSENVLGWSTGAHKANTHQWHKTHVDIRLRRHGDLRKLFRGENRLHDAAILESTMAGVDPMFSVPESMTMSVHDVINQQFSNLQGEFHDVDVITDELVSLRKQQLKNPSRMLDLLGDTYRKRFNTVVCIPSELPNGIKRSTNDNLLYTIDNKIVRQNIAPLEHRCYHKEHEYDFLYLDPDSKRTQVLEIGVKLPILSLHPGAGNDLIARTSSTISLISDILDDENARYTTYTPNYEPLAIARSWTLQNEACIATSGNDILIWDIERDLSEARVWRSKELAALHERLELPANQLPRFAKTNGRFGQHTTIEYGSHPRQLLVAAGREITMVDLRSNAPLATTLYKFDPKMKYRTTQMISTEGKKYTWSFVQDSYTAMCKVPWNDNQLMLGTNSGKLVMIDSRFGRAPINEFPLEYNDQCIIDGVIPISGSEGQSGCTDFLVWSKLRGVISYLSNMTPTGEFGVFETIEHGIEPNTSSLAAFNGISIKGISQLPDSFTKKKDSNDKHATRVHNFVASFGELDYGLDLFRSAPFADEPCSCGDGQDCEPNSSIKFDIHELKETTNRLCENFSSKNMFENKNASVFVKYVRDRQSNTVINDITEIPVKPLIPDIQPTVVGCNTLLSEMIQPNFHYEERVTTAKKVNTKLIEYRNVETNVGVPSEGGSTTSVLSTPKKAGPEFKASGDTIKMNVLKLNEMVIPRIKTSNSNSNNDNESTVFSSLSVPLLPEYDFGNETTWSENERLLLKASTTYSADPLLSERLLRPTSDRIRGLPCWSLAALNEFVLPCSNAQSEPIIFSKFASRLMQNWVQEDADKSKSDLCTPLDVLLERKPHFKPRNLEDPQSEPEISVSDSQDYVTSRLSRSQRSVGSSSQRLRSAMSVVSQSQQSSQQSQRGFRPSQLTQSQVTESQRKRRKKGF